MKIDMFCALQVPRGATRSLLVSNMRFIFKTQTSAHLKGEPI